MVEIKFKKSNLYVIGQQLIYNEPDIYDAEIPEALSILLPHLANAAKGEHVHSAPWFSSKLLSSVGGQVFTSFAKSGKFGKGKCFSK